MATFRGNHPAKVDEKGRLKLPAAFKQLMDTDGVKEFYITSTDGKRAEIWPLPEWEKVEERLSGASALDEAVEEYTNLVNYYGQQVEIDGQGRLVLPQILRNKASLDGDVTVIGMRSFVAVHNRENFERALPPEGLNDEHRKTVAAILSGRE
jgi:MraZ protein